jgi:hypothetical protein
MSTEKEIINPSNTFTEKEWNDFLSLRLPTDKEKEFLDLSEQDEFFKDAFEGIQSIPNRAQVLSVVNNINNKVRTRVGTPKTQVVLQKFDFNIVRIVSIAAIFLIIIGMGFLFFYLTGNDHNELAQTESVAAIENGPATETNASPSPVANDTNVIVTEASPAIAMNNDPIYKNNTNQNTVSNIPKKSIPNNSASGNTQNEVNKKDDFTTDIAATSSSNAGVTISNQNTIALSEEVEIPAPAIEKKAAMTEKITAVSRDSQMSDIETSDSKWSKAMSFLSNGEKKKAKKILKELANSQNPYTQRAKEELKKLSFF